MSEWPKPLQDIIEEFVDVFDPMERYEMLFELASEVNELPVDEWNEGNRIHGCQSEAHVECSLQDGLFFMRGGADAQIVQGLMAITCLAVNGRAPKEVANLEPTFIEQMNLKASLTPSRSNGFLNMFKRIKDEATLLSEGE
ncbi:MAG: SufE family protein [Candidatus Thalassarchaeaceae archaeon]|jgi:cysteine desulfuration protein SufE|nr:SufE family protein [Candidatus Thalassarchaeaceae archaeon]